MDVEKVTESINYSLFDKEESSCQILPSVNSGRVNVLRMIRRACPVCEELRDMEIIVIDDSTVFKGENITFSAQYVYCPICQEQFEMNEQISENNLAMKDAYRLKMGLLTTYDIRSIRSKYGISQSDLCTILEWGTKTITRYEGHQVQDAAHDAVLKKINNDPEWFISLLQQAKSKLPNDSYQKYFDTATKIYKAAEDSYRQKTIRAEYADFKDNAMLCGGTELRLDKVVDVIRYFANSRIVTSLYKVKLMKLLWYADALSFKRFGESITGLAYRALPMGAVPVGYESLIELRGVKYEEIEFDDSTGCHFVSDENSEYNSLSSNDISVIDDVIKLFGDLSKNEIVNRMHNEKAYTETALYDIIQFKYAKDLSIE